MGRNGNGGKFKIQEPFEQFYTKVDEVAEISVDFFGEELSIEEDWRQVLKYVLRN